MQAEELVAAVEAARVEALAVLAARMEVVGTAVRRKGSTSRRGAS